VCEVLIDLEGESLEGRGGGGKLLGKQKGGLLQKRLGLHVRKKKNYNVDATSRKTKGGKVLLPKGGGSFSTFRRGSQR